MIISNTTSVIVNSTAITDVRLYSRRLFDNVFSIVAYRNIVLKKWIYGG